MSIWYGNNAGYTANTGVSTSNWVLDASTTSNYARVLEVSWGGEMTTTTAVRTRWLRPTTSGLTTFSLVGVVQGNNPNTTVKFRFGTASTNPTAPAAPSSLYATSWNAHGGIGRWLASPGEEWYIIGVLSVAQIVSLNDIGSGPNLMSAGVAWDEF